MPVIEVKIQDFRDLLGRQVSVFELRERLPMMGTSWEGDNLEGFNLEIFPNRPDLLSIEGLVRAYSSFTGESPGFREYSVMNSNYVVNVERKVENVRPYFVSAVIENVEFDDILIKSVIQMQEKLHVTHGRRRRKVAIGLHNLDPIEFPVTYTTKPKEFKFRPLGERFEKSLEEIINTMPVGEEYSWILEGFNEYPILIDNKGMVLSMPPIINGEYTRIDEATSNIFIDITGTELKAINEVLNIITSTFADRGAKIFKSMNNYYTGWSVDTPNLMPTAVGLDLSYVNSILGIELSDDDIRKYLSLMGYGFKERSSECKKIMVLVPPYRTDIMHAIDLVEDVAIAYGYDKFEPVIPSICSVAGEDPLEVFSRKLRNFMVGFGLLEVVTFMMSNNEKLFDKMILPEEPIAETANPKMAAYTSLRNRLLPSLLEVLYNNKHHSYPQNLFEIDDVIVLDPSTEVGARTVRRLSVVICHSKANFSEVKAIMDNIFDVLKVRPEIEEKGWNCFVEGRRCIGSVDGKALCWAGEIKPEVIVNWELELPIAALEMDISFLHNVIQEKL